MRITVRLFSLLRRDVGADEVALELPEGARLRDAIASLLDRHETLRPYAPSCMTAVGLEYAPPDHELRDGDEISLIPPVSGG